MCYAEIALEHLHEVQFQLSTCKQGYFDVDLVTLSIYVAVLNIIPYLSTSPSLKPNSVKPSQRAGAHTHSIDVHLQSVYKSHS